MSLRRGEEVLVDVERLAQEGHGVGRLDGLVVFVEKALPGERVRARVRRVKRNFIQARAVEVLSPAPERTQSRCSHVSTCGGCTWQELQYPAIMTAIADTGFDGWIAHEFIPTKVGEAGLAQARDLCTV